jgi:hypothetical protein
MRCRATGCWHDWVNGCCARVVSSSPAHYWAIHELALAPDSISDEVKTDVRQSLARAIKVNARPLTVAE